MFWNLYPYTDFHELNLDMILRMMRDLHKDWDEFKALNTITIMGEWSIANSYPAWSIVTTSGGQLAYISTKPVPAGVLLTNTDYWEKIYDYSIVIDEINARLSALESRTTFIDPYEKFRGKTICAIGDSITDYATLANNWLKYIDNKLSDYNVTIINQGKNGQSFAGLANEIAGGTFTVATADYYILFLGTNYADSWGFSTGSDPLIPAMNSVISAIQTANPEAHWIFVSPLKKWLTGMDQLLNPLAMVRSYLEKTMANFGYTVVSGYNVGELTGNTMSRYMTDTVHPTEAFTPILGEYIMDALVSERSNVTSPSSVERNYINTLSASSLIYFKYDTSNLKLTIKISANGWTPGTGAWVDICDLPTMFDSVPFPNYIMSTYGGETHQYRNNGNKLQAYFFVAPGASFNDMVEFVMPFTNNN